MTRRLFNRWTITAVVLLGIGVALLVAWPASPKVPQSTGSYPVIVKGVLPDGTRFESHYWGNQNRRLGYALVRPGEPQPWLEAEKRASSTRDFEKFATYFSDDSQAKLRRNAPRLAKEIAKLEPYDNSNDPHQVPLIITIHTGREDDVYIVDLGSYEEVEQFRPPFGASIYRKQKDGYKIKIDAINRELLLDVSEGRWKQFGTPRDFTAATMPKPEPPSLFRRFIQSVSRFFGGN